MRLGMGLLAGAMTVACASGCGGSGYSMRAESPVVRAAKRINVDVPVGTVVPVRLTGTVGTHEDHRITHSQFVTTAPVRGASGEVVVHPGTPIAVAAESDKPNIFGVRGHLYAQFDGVQAFDGTYVPLKGGTHVRGESRVGRALGLGIGLTPLLGPFAWFFFGKHGTHATLSGGTVLNATVISADEYVHRRNR